MAKTFYTNVFRTQENVNKDNMNYTVADKDQKLSAFFPMPIANANGILPGVICSGIGTIDNQFGFNSTSNQFILNAGILRFPDAISNNTPYSITNQTASISQFLELAQPNPQPALTTPLVDNTYYLISTLQVNGIGGAYQYTNNSPLIPYTIISTSLFTGINQIALCLITISGGNVTISTDINCAVNYGTKPSVFFQQGRLNGIGIANSITAPYDDTLPAGSPTLYFTPTEQGNLISLYNGTSWVTQPFSELSLPVGGLLDSLNTSFGALTPLGSLQQLTSPSGVTVSPDGLNVYTVNYEINNSISAFSISGSGNNIVVSSIKGAFTGASPIRIAISPDGLSAYVTNYFGNTVSQYSRTAGTGILFALTNRDIPAGNQPYGIAISPNLSGQNSHVYCVNTNSNSIWQYNRNTSNSILTYNSVAGAGLNPTEIIVSPDGLHVYCTNNANADQGNTVSQYSRDTNSGELTPIIPSIATGTNPRGIAISPDGNFVYVVNNGAQSVSQYSRNSSSGILTPFTTRDVSAGYYSDQIAISPDGLNVYVTNSYIPNVGGDNTISEYRRDLNTGQLTSFGTAVTGTNPIQIAITPNGNNAFVTNNTDGSISYYNRTLPTAPTVSLTNPRPPLNNVSLNTSISIKFSEAVIGVNTNTIQFRTQGGALQTITITSTGNNTYTLTGQTLVNATTYLVIINSGITSVATTLAVAPIQFTFTTIPTGPTVQLISPTPTTNVSLTPTIQLQFSQAVSNVTTTTINFKVKGGNIIPITITSSGNVYTINLTQQLSLSTFYSVVVNSGIQTVTSPTQQVVPITFDFSTTFPPVNLYDVYVANLSNVLVLATDIFSSPTGNNRIQLSNGKWINAHTIQTPNGNIQPRQGLLVGSIAVYNGLVQSWTGNRSIWNLYNQVSKSLVANAGSIDPTSSSNQGYLWSYPNSTTSNNFRNQNTNNINGTGRLSFILDLLYNKGLVLLYNGSGVSGLGTNTGITGITANNDLGDGTIPPTSAIQLLSFAIYGNDPAISTSTTNNWHTLSYVYNYNSSILQPVSNIAVGFNFIQKIEKTFTTGYFSDTGGGLSCEFWG